MLPARKVAQNRGKREECYFATRLLKCVLLCRYVFEGDFFLNDIIMISRIGEDHSDIDGYLV